MSPADQTSDQPGEVDAILGPPYLAETIDFAEDEQGPVVTTLVHRRAERPTTKAVLINSSQSSPQLVSQFQAPPLCSSKASS